MARKATASKQDIYARLAEMKIGDTCHLRYADLNFTEIGHLVRNYGKRNKMRFRIEADFHKGLGVTRITGSLQAPAQAAERARPRYHLLAIAR